MDRGFGEAEGGYGGGRRGYGQKIWREDVKERMWRSGGRNGYEGYLVMIVPYGIRARHELLLTNDNGLSSQFHHKKRLQFLAAFALLCSPAWARTRDPMINSHVL